MTRPICKVTFLSMTTRWQFSYRIRKCKTSGFTCQNHQTKQWPTTETPKTKVQLWEMPVSFDIFHGIQLYVYLTLGDTKRIKQQS